jgi:hypothetical protein
MRFRKLVASRALLMFCILLAVTFSASAAEKKKETLVLQGLGATSCAQFADFFRDSPKIEEEYFDWAQGFMSGLNMNADVYVVLNAKSIDEEKRFLRRYCDAHPLGEFMDAIYDLMKTLPTVEKKR